MGLFSKERKDNNGNRLVNNRFMLAFPPGWTDRSVYRFDGPLEDGIQHHITINIEHDVEITELEKYAQLQIKAVESALHGYRELKRGPVTLDNWQPAFELVYKWCPMENVETYQRMIWTLHDRTAYAFTAVFSKKTWKMFADQVDQIIRTFTVLMPPS